MGFGLDIMAERTFRASAVRTMAGPVIMGVLISLSGFRPPEPLLISKIAALAVAIVILRRIYVMAKRGVETFELNDAGFSLSKWEGRINWSDVNRIMTYSSPFQSHIVFFLKDVTVAEPLLPWYRKLLSIYSRRPETGEVWVSTSLYPDKHADILSATFDAFSAAVPGSTRTEKECRATIVPA